MTGEATKTHDHLKEKAESYGLSAKRCKWRRKQHRNKRKLSSLKYLGETNRTSSNANFSLHAAKEQHFSEKVHEKACQEAKAEERRLAKDKIERAGHEVKAEEQCLAEEADQAVSNACAIAILIEKEGLLLVATQAPNTHSTSPRVQSRIP